MKSSDKCPVCRCKYTTSENRLINKLLNVLETKTVVTGPKPCVHKTFGCDVYQSDTHDSDYCVFRPIHFGRCPLPIGDDVSGCDYWTGLSNSTNVFAWFLHVIDVHSRSHVTVGIEQMEVLPLFMNYGSTTTHMLTVYHGIYTQYWVHIILTIKVCGDGLVVSVRPLYVDKPKEGYVVKIKLPAVSSVSIYLKPKDFQEEVVKINRSEYRNLTGLLDGRAQTTVFAQITVCQHIM